MRTFRLPIALGLACCLALPVAAAEPQFERQTIDGEIEIGYGLALGRVDADELQDLLLADKQQIVWYQNPGIAGEPWRKHVIARNLTPRDNVCLAARDIDGDGLVEIAVGANWNPRETTDASASGNLFYLRRPKDPTKMWTSIPITPHEPTTHRMHWIDGDSGFQLAVLPLHGVANKGGAGKPVQIGLYRVNEGGVTADGTLNTGMHMTHNFELTSHEEHGDHEFMLVGGKEGVVGITTAGGTFPLIGSPQSKGVGEVRRYPNGGRTVVAIEPMHGSDVVLYNQQQDGSWSKEVLDVTLNEGHALAAGNLLGDATAEVVAGWRGADSNGKVGIKLYSKQGDGWTTHVLDDNQTACEDLKLADLNADGKLDVIGAGRATKNVVVYWNQSE